MKQTFEELGISPPLVKGLIKQGISIPTAIQKETIPTIIGAGDLIGQSATGTGKTLAYLLPLFERINPDIKETQALILAPTHELAMQIFRQAQLLAKNSELSLGIVALIGDVNISRQIEKLKQKPQLIVGSGGRILELIQKRKIQASTIRMVVLDEADRLVDENHRQNLTAVLKSTAPNRQILCFSATIPRQAVEWIRNWSKDLVLVEQKMESAIPAEISHWSFGVEARDKTEFLRKLLASLNLPRVLVFINTASAIGETVAKLCHHGVAAAGIHGSSFKLERQGAMEAFRDGRVKVLISSDLAARGLDIQEVSCVVNLEIPEDPQAYQHRAGRTGRAGQPGLVASLVDRSEAKRLEYLQQKLRIKVQPKRLVFGKVIN